MQRLRTVFALVVLSSLAEAGQLLLDGLTAATEPVGGEIVLSLTGSPGRPAFLLADVTPGPVLFGGESVPLGFTPALTLIPLGNVPGSGVVSLFLDLPSDPDLAGFTVYLAGVVLDPVDPNGKDWSNGASLGFTLAVDAGATAATLVGVPLTLDGSGSQVLPGSAIEWTILSAPPGSSAVLVGAGTSFPVLSPDLPGDYVVRATVSSHTASYSDQATVHAWRLQLGGGLVDGAILPGASTFVSGTLSGPPSTALKLNGATLAKDAFGNFGPVSVSFAGAVHLPLMFEVVHADGTAARQRLTLVQGTAAALGAPASKALQAQLEQPALTQVGELGAQLLAGSDIESFLLALPPEQVANETGPFGFTIFSASIDFTGLSYDRDIDLALDATTSGLLSTVTIRDVRADFHVSGEILEIDYDLDGYITTDPTLITGRLVGSAAGGQLEVAVLDVGVDRQNFDFELSGFFGTLAELFVIESAVKEDVEATIASTVSSDLGPAVADVLNSFVVAGSLLGTLDVAVSIAAPITGVVHSDHGVTVQLDADAGIDAVEPGSPVITQYRLTPGAPPAFGMLTPGGAGYGAGLSVGDDALNHVLAAATGAGLLDGDLTSLVPDSGAPVSLDVADLTLIFGSAGFENFPAGTEVKLRAHGTLPPLLLTTPGGPGTARLLLSNLVVEFEVPAAGGALPILRVGVDGQADLALDLLRDGSLAASLLDSELQLTVLRSFPGSSLASLDSGASLLQFLLEFALPELIAALGALPLPSLEAAGLGLVPSEAGLLGEHLGFWGTLQTGP